MDSADIENRLDLFTESIDSDTFLGTYKVINRKSLLTADSTRANSLWKMVEFLVCPYDNQPNSIDLYINGWKKIAGNYKNQYLFLEENSGIWGMYDSQGKKLGDNSYIDGFLSKKTINVNSQNEPLQQIFYGAPGTGKSHKIKKLTKDESVIRTTFHPDSDYSTFVGCYKPSIDKNNDNQQIILDYDGLVDKFKEYLGKQNNVTKACVLFGHDYHDSIVKMQESKIHTITDLLADAYKSGTTFDTPLRAGMNVYEYNPKENKNNRVIYSFVPQAFTKAYTAAWNTTDAIYLIIEEINRGNCAQIFGDLFQLLDRKDGVSEYPVDADSDLAEYLHKELADSTRDDFPEGVKEGEKLVLPSNLYIWATMNTSDQSLFPIDSAFKRRWDWRYIKIKKGRDEDGNELDWKIIVKDKDENIVKINNKDSLSWWDFISKINEIIASMTSSADKQMGYFFCKADNEGVISADVFVSKVIFYLWNDVFKDYGFEDASLFQYKEMIDGKEVTKDLTFPDFYDEEGEKVNEVRLKVFLESVMDWKKEERRA